MDFRLPQEVERIFQEMTAAGYEIYLVGGAVRDMIMGKPVDDWDFTTNATPEQILKVFPDAYYNNRFGTVGVPATEGSGFNPHEITTFRSEEEYSDARRPDKVTWGTSLTEDLKRRDFTINAIALAKNEECELMDPYDGQKDIKKRLIKAVGEPNERFSEDALRLMRAVRIASELNFKIEEKTLHAIKANASLINKIAKERVRDELLKIVASMHPVEGITLFRETGLMDEILPELSKTFGVEQKSPGRHHIYDVGTHCLMSLKHCNSTDSITRFATLIHDIGKPQTFKIINGTITFYNHEMVSAKIARNIAERLRFSKDQKDKLVTLVRWHQFTVDEHQTDSAIRRFIRHVGKENIDEMLALRTGDRLGGGAKETSWRLEEFKKRLIEVQKEPFTVHDLKITGHDIMKELNIKPGPEIGKILNQIFNEVVEKKVPNKKKELVSWLKENY